MIATLSLSLTFLIFYQQKSQDIGETHDRNIYTENKTVGFHEQDKIKELLAALTLWGYLVSNITQPAKNYLPPFSIISKIRKRGVWGKRLKLFIL